MHYDGQSDLAKHQVFHSRKKHIDVRFHNTRELIVAGEVIFEKIHTSENVADVLTN